MNQVLVIVDMQWEFLKCTNDIRRAYKLIDNICHTIDVFEEHQNPVVVVEYVIDNVIEDRRKKNLYTAKKIIDKVKNYENLYYATKKDDDGGREIIRALNGYRYLHDYDDDFQNALHKNQKSPFPLTEKTTFYLTGVNASACVLATAFGLSQQGYCSLIIPTPCSLDTFTGEWVNENPIFQEEEIRRVVTLI